MLKLYALFTTFLNKFHSIVDQSTFLFTATMSTKSPGRCDLLLSWARSNGAIIPSTLLFAWFPYGHCRTTVPIAGGTHLFHIPYHLILTHRVALQSLPQLVETPVHAILCT